MKTTYKVILNPQNYQIFKEQELNAENLSKKTTSFGLLSGLRRTSSAV